MQRYDDGCICIWMWSTFTVLLRISSNRVEGGFERENRTQHRCEHIIICMLCRGQLKRDRAIKPTIRIIVMVNGNWHLCIVCLNTIRPTRASGHIVVILRGVWMVHSANLARTTRDPRSQTPTRECCARTQDSRTRSQDARYIIYVLYICKSLVCG